MKYLKKVVTEITIKETVTITALPEPEKPSPKYTANFHIGNGVAVFAGPWMGILCLWQHAQKGKFLIWYRGSKRHSRASSSIKHKENTPAMSRGIFVSRTNEGKLWRAACLLAQHSIAEFATLLYHIPPFLKSYLPLTERKPARSPFATW